jgi:hypothetical protein
LNCKKSSKLIEIRKSKLDVTKELAALNNLENKGSPYIRLDIYKRKQKLEYWKHRIDSYLIGSDRLDVLKLVTFMEDNERASLWIIRCISALLQIRPQLGKAFKPAATYYSNNFSQLLNMFIFYTTKLSQVAVWLISLQMARLGKDLRLVVSRLPTKW